MNKKQYCMQSLLFLVFLFHGFIAHAIPDIQTWKTDNGVEVLFVESPTLPMVDIQVTFDAGSARDGRLPGLASLTNGLLVEGSDGLSAQEIAERFESVGAIINIDSLRDMAVVGVRSLTDERYLKIVINTLKKVLSKPDFTSRAFNRDLASMKVSVRAGKQSPATIASEAFYKALYGNHPYATPIGGTDESLAVIKRADVKRFYKKYYVAKNAQIVIVGAVSKKRAKQIANEIVGNMPDGSEPNPIPAVLPLKEAKTINIDFPSKQSHILVGQTGIKRGDDDYFTLYVANHPFGGSGFASRLLGTIREEHGLVYSVYSYFLPMREHGPFIMGMQTKTENKDRVLALLNSELVEYINNGPSKDELKASVDNIVGSYPLRLDNNKKLLGYLAMIGFYELPMDYLQNFVANIEKVSLSNIVRTIKRRIHPDKMITVVVGKKS